ncbi:MAG: Di-heme cytochrome c peroxidase [Gemmatimonadetes bacterium]|nr:Di-heme cytochrome c peroxidase [Gemmatimonadota bacterium]
MFIFALMRLKPWSRAALLGVVVALILMFTTNLHAVSRKRTRWSSKERVLLRSLTLKSLGAIPRDPSNRVADDSTAASFGQLLFFDARLSSTGTVSCATCHMAEKNFQDGRPVGRGVGEGSRRTMPIAGTSRSPWLFWDGRADSQWEQALGPLENPVEHGGDRTQYARLIAVEYRTRYESIFGRLPSLGTLPFRAGPVGDTVRAAAWARIPGARRDEISRVYANIGKAIAAYERRIDFAPARFDRYVEAELASDTLSSPSLFTPDEEAGLRLFIGKASCVNCHNGGLFSDGHFHNTGVAQSRATALPDSGRTSGVLKALAGEFSCTSRYSDATAQDCAELRFAVAEGPELVRAYKPPSLRNVVDRAPYMHAGQLATLDRVLEHYSSAPRAPLGRSELKPLHLSWSERRQIIAFLGTLTGPLTAPPGFLAAPANHTVE